ncbi:MAG: hypothetical protein EOO87_09275 [Pedobacter sp.]|nr:MAG: hypothetical protein EOO87_09275 [Pedobacter sp.]
MAKVRSIIKLSGTLAETTFVDSKTYGAHARAKRGTYKPIALADGMQKSAVVQTKVNELAKIVFDAVNVFVPGFKDGKFWSRLLSVFRQQQKAGKDYNYRDFNQLEMRLDYPSSKHGAFWVANGEGCSVLLHYQIAKDTVYLLRLLRMGSDESLLFPYVGEVQETIVEGLEKLNAVSFNFSDLPKEANVLYVLHCEQMIDGMPAGILKCQSVKFLVSF